jgi:putative ABC transport system permease protein
MHKQKTRTIMEIRPIFSALMRNKTAPLLVAMQVAISLAILANALHIVHLRQQVADRPSGVADEASVFRLYAAPLKFGNHQETLARHDRELLALKAIPGVVSVARTNQVPLARSGSDTGFALRRDQAQTTGETSNYHSEDSLVKTLGLKLLEGRDFTPADVVEEDINVENNPAAKVVIVTQALAQALYPGSASVVGKTMFFGTGNDADEMRIIGVVERMQSTRAQVGESAEYSSILPVRSSIHYVQFVIRAEPGQRDRVMREAEETIRRISGMPMIIKTRSMEQDRQNRYRADKALGWTLLAVSGLLLLVTASGITGMAALWVAQRRKQIGVRRALGARKIDILRYFLTENFLITSGGVGAGVLLALGLNQLLVSHLELSRLPAGYLMGGAGVLWLLGLLAAYGPAWKAASIPPAVATRTA